MDTTIYDRNRSRCIELLSRVHDHCIGRFLNGFRMLTLGWSDGASFVPLDHAVLSSRKKRIGFKESPSRWTHARVVHGGVRMPSPNPLS